MLIELRELGLFAQSQQRINAADCLNPAHEAQLVNYLRGTDIEVGILLNFGEKPDQRRRVLTKDYK